MPVKATSSSSSEIQTSSQAFLGSLTRLSSVSKVTGGEAEALGGGVEEIVAVRIFDQVLPRIIDGRLVRAFASEIVRQIEWVRMI